MAAPTLPAAWDVYLDATNATEHIVSGSNLLAANWNYQWYGQASNSDLLYVVKRSSTIYFYYSTDEGASWSQCSSSISPINTPGVGTDEGGLSAVVDHVNNMIFLAFGDTGSDNVVLAVSYNTGTNDVTLEAEYQVDLGSTDAYPLSNLLLSYDAVDPDLVYVTFLWNDDNVEQIGSLQYDVGLGTLAAVGTFQTYSSINLLDNVSTRLYPNTHVTADSALTAPWIFDFEDPLWTAGVGTNMSVGSIEFVTGNYADQSDTDVTITGFGTNLGAGLFYRSETDNWIGYTIELDTTLKFKIATNNNTDPKLGTWTAVYDSFADDSTSLNLETSAAHKYDVGVVYDDVEDTLYATWWDTSDEHIYSLKYVVSTDTSTITDHGLGTTTNGNPRQMALMMSVKTGGGYLIGLLGEIRESTGTIHLAWKEIASTSWSSLITDPALTDADTLYVDSFARIITDPALTDSDTFYIDVLDQLLVISDPVLTNSNTMFVDVLDATRYVTDPSLVDADTLNVDALGRETNFNPYWRWRFVRQDGGLYCIPVKSAQSWAGADVVSSDFRFGWDAVDYIQTAAAAAWASDSGSPTATLKAAIDTALGSFGIKDMEGNVLT